MSTGTDPTAPDIPPTPDPGTTPDIPPTPQPDVVPEPAPNSAAAATWTASDWLGKVILDREGKRIGKLHDVYVNVETDEPQFGTVKEGFLDRHLTFVPPLGVIVGPDELRVTALRAQVRSAPDLDLHGQEMSQADESALYHHFEMNCRAIDSESGRRLARR